MRIPASATAIAGMMAWSAHVHARRAARCKFCFAAPRELVDDIESAAGYILSLGRPP
jgi:hypothetical protein